MAQEAKFSITLKPRWLDEVPGAVPGATGIVAAERYLGFTTEALLAYAQKLGLTTPPTPVLMRDEITYMGPLASGEELKICVQSIRIGRTSWGLEYQLNEASTGRPIATVTEVRVLIDAEAGRSTPWPDEWKQKIIAFEGKDNVEVAGK
jgi:acyl-CoA thioesterase FadM